MEGVASLCIEIVFLLSYHWSLERMSQSSFFVTCYCSVLPVSHLKALSSPSFAVHGVSDSMLGWGTAEEVHFEGKVGKMYTFS